MRTSSEKAKSDKYLSNTWALLNEAFFFFYHKTEDCTTAFSPLAIEMLGDEISSFSSKTRP